MVVAPAALARVVGDLVTMHVAVRYAWTASIIPAGARVLDVGCGTGAGTATLADTGAVVVGIDHPGVAAAARRAIGSVAELVPGSLEQLPAGDASFDVVVCVNGLESGKDPKSSLAELLRVLGPGGLLIVAAAPPRDTGHDNVDGVALAELLADHGLNVATFAESAWLVAAIHDGRDRIAIDAAAPPAPLLVLASTAPLPTPAPIARVATEMGVLRLRALERELQDARDRAVAAERRRDEVMALEARLAEAERELASLFELELALGAALEDRDAARADAASARAEKDAARGDAAALRASTTWRAAAPLRWLSARARGKPYA